jgi:hypothetical protein
MRAYTFLVGYLRRAWHCLATGHRPFDSNWDGRIQTIACLNCARIFWSKDGAQ